MQSHSAMSTAEIACAARPGSPALRTARCMASFMRGTSKAGQPATTSASRSSMMCAAAAGA
ncbi:hypothetical protein QFZ55_000250 [Streptomyces luteogriseus]|nr:hypothetical protein [Streptomyces luteogriseus]